MKIKLIKKHKPVEVGESTLTKHADEIGEAYMNIKERMKPLEKDLQDASSRAKAFGAKFGEARGSRKTVVGDNYEVGVMFKGGSKLNTAKLFKLLPWVKAKVMRLTVDENIIYELVQKGKIEQTTLAKCVEQTEPIMQVYVAKVAKNQQ